MENEIVSSIAHVIRQVRPDAESALLANESLADFLDSFDIVMLVEEIEFRFNVSISGDHIIPENFANLQTLTKLIKDCQK